MTRGRRQAPMWLKEVFKTRKNALGIEKKVKAFELIEYVYKEETDEAGVSTKITPLNRKAKKITEAKNGNKVYKRFKGNGKDPRCGIWSKWFGQDKDDRNSRRQNPSN